MKTGSQILTEYNDQPSNLETFVTLEQMIDIALNETDLAAINRANPGVLMYAISVKIVGDMFYGTEDQLADCFGIDLDQAEGFAESNDAVLTIHNIPK